MDIVGKRRRLFVLSGLVIAVGLVSLILPGGLTRGIDFTSGATMTLDFDVEVSQGALRAAYGELGHDEAVIQRTGEGNYLVRTFVLGQPERDEAGNVVEPGERETLEEALRARFGALTVLDFTLVGPEVAEEAVRNAAIAVLAATVGILLYITWAFRRMPRPFRYGVGAIVALAHDVLVVLGIYSLLARVYPLEVNLMFITALLTVIGYSVHDTIVVFDRIRENMDRAREQVAKGYAVAFDVLVNNSILETLGRSLNTSMTVAVVLLALLLFGGVTLSGFVVVILAGIITGTYSSVFVASQVLVEWERPRSELAEEVAAEA